MAMTIDVSGMEDVSRMIRELGERAQGIAAQGLYEGAGIMADGIRAGAQGIRTAPFQYARPGETRLPSPEEKAVVLAAKGEGISKFRKNGDEVQTSIGYSKAGYADLNGKTVPIPLIVNSINSGTSFMQKQAFFRRAVNRAKEQASAAIAGNIEAEMDAIIKK